MDFKQDKQEVKNEQNYHIENLRIVRAFSKELIVEMKDLIKSIVLFGSNTKNTQNKDSDIDLMIVLDNVSVFVTPELREAYKIILDKLIRENSSKLHVMTVNFSDCFDMARKGDPVLINVLRYGISIFDNNLIEPLQYLLEIGKIRPTKEAVYNYMSRANTLLDETKNHLNLAVLDLYYAVVDIVHSAIITQKKVPPSPKDMPKIFEEIFSKKCYKKYSDYIRELYDVAKKIEHNADNKITGVYYDDLKSKTSKLVSFLNKFNHEQLEKKDLFEL